MTSKNAAQFKRSPKVVAPDEQLAREEEFISGADVRRNTPELKTVAAKRRSSKSTQLDFLELDDDDRTKLMNVRFTQREKGALLYIQKQTTVSMHAFCMEAIRDAINAKLRKIADVEL
jgi:hypothetical protein